MKLSKLLLIYALLSAIPCQARKKPTKSIKAQQSSASTSTRGQEPNKAKWLVGGGVLLIVGVLLFHHFSNKDSNNKNNPKPLKNLECLYCKHFSHKSDDPSKSRLQSIDIHKGNHSSLKKGEGYKDEFVNIEPFIIAINLMAHFGKEDKIDAIVQARWVSGKEWEEKDEQAYKQTRQAIIKETNHLARFIDQSILDQVNTYLTNKGSEEDTEDPPAIYDEQKENNIRLIIPSLQNKIKDLKYIIDISAIVKEQNERIKKAENQAKELEAEKKQAKQEALIKNYSNLLKTMQDTVGRGNIIQNCIKDFDTLTKRFEDLQNKNKQGDKDTIARLKKMQSLYQDQDNGQSISFISIVRYVNSITKDIKDFKANYEKFEQEAGNFDENGEFDQQQKIFKEAQQAYHQLGTNAIFNAHHFHDRVKRDLNILDTLDGLKIDN